MGEAVITGTLITPQAYLAGELTAELRSEYVRGRVDRMPGASAIHAELVTNLMVDIGSLLDRGRGRIYANDLKLGYGDGQVDDYPDLVICCDPSDHAAYWRERPRYVLEIRSPETLRGDAGEKKAAYFGLASIESYLQSRQSRLFVTVNRRTPGSSFWSEEVLEQPGNPMRLESLGSNSRSVRSTAAPPNAGYGRPAALSRPICHATALAAEDRQAVSALGLSGDLLASGAPEHHEPARRRRQPTVRPGVVRRGLRRSPAAMRYSSL